MASFLNTTEKQHQAFVQSEMEAVLCPGAKIKNSAHNLCKNKQVSGESKRSLMLMD